ncbi:MAG TPA: hypothetical protein VG013_08295, partial [Gemmataceae bacterium]|nr:hypothetical protein [Gemmataceae bacterium]
MHRPCPRLLAALVAAGTLLPPSPAQQPSTTAQPTVAPNLARLDQTIDGLDGPGFGLAYSEEGGILAAACEGGTIQYWHRGEVQGVRLGSGTPNVLKGHRGPVTALAWGGAVLASAGVDEKIVLWSMPAGKVVKTVAAGRLVRA